MRNTERRIEDNKSIIADLKSSWDPSSCRCFVDVFLNRQLKLEVRWHNFPFKWHNVTGQPTRLVSCLLRNQKPRTRTTMSKTWSTV